MLLLTREKIGGKQLAEMFEVSLRTTYRDIESINRAGIPIVTTPGKDGGIGIMKEYKVEKGIFTATDITAMLMGLGFVSNTLSLVCAGVLPDKERLPVIQVVSYF